MIDACVATQKQIEFVETVTLDLDSLTSAWSRRPTASAPLSLPLPGAAHAQRYRAKKSLASLAG